MAKLFREIYLVRQRFVVIQLFAKKYEHEHVLVFQLPIPALFSYLQRHMSQDSARNMAPKYLFWCVSYQFLPIQLLTKTYGFAPLAPKHMGTLYTYFASGPDVFRRR